MSQALSATVITSAGADRFSRCTVTPPPDEPPLGPDEQWLVYRGPKTTPNQVAALFLIENTSGPEAPDEPSTQAALHLMALAAPAGSLQGQHITVSSLASVAAAEVPQVGQAASDLQALVHEVKGPIDFAAGVRIAENLFNLYADARGLLGK